MLKQRLSLADKALQGVWIRNELPAIKRAQREHGVLLYEDEALFSDNLVLFIATGPAEESDRR